MCALPISGNLYASLFLRAPADVDLCAQLSFVSAVSLQQAVVLCSNSSHHACEVKWPNDVLWNGAKLAGLLLEAKQQGDDMNIVIGMGVNCAHHPDDTPYPATNLKQEGFDVKPRSVFEALKHRAVENIAIWNKGAGFEAIRAKWLQVARGLGDTIIVRLETDEVRGVFEDIDPEGHLILAESGGRRRSITAGDVFFPSFTR